MSVVNAVLGSLFDALLYPFRGMPLVGLIVMSLLTSIGMLLVFKATSNQSSLETVKRKIHACLFEIRLFNDDFRAIFRAQNEILRHNLVYLRLSLVPMIWIIVPLFFVVAQLHFHYGYRGLQPGEQTVVTVLLDHPVGQRPTVTLEAPTGVRVESPGVWVPSLQEVSWRIEADEAGDYELGVTVDGSTQSKRLLVGDEVARTSPWRKEATFVDQLLYPAEPALPRNNPIRSITVDYPEAEVDLFGWRTHWMVGYFLLSIVFSFVLRGPLKVQI